MSALHKHNNIYSFILKWCFCIRDMHTFEHEWFFMAPWGKIAMVSWGCIDSPPILVVHGRQDSIATFIPLMQYMPLDFFYVGFDLPGHGKSDPFPISTALTRLHFVSAIEEVVKHMEWTRFAYMGHSIGSELGLFYNAAHPFQITKFVHIDVAPALQSNQQRPLPKFYDQFYAKYYNNYNETNNDDRVYTKKKAMYTVMRARGLDEKLAKIVLSRNLKKIGHDQYTLSWDKRLKMPVPLNQSCDYLLPLLSSNAPPTLFIRAAMAKSTYPDGLEPNNKLIVDLAKNIKHFYYKLVNGTHDVHLTNPQSVAQDITLFLQKDFSTPNVVSKI